MHSTDLRVLVILAPWMPEELCFPKLESRTPPSHQDNFVYRVPLQLTVDAQEHKNIIFHDLIRVHRMIRFAFHVALASFVRVNLGLIIYLDLYPFEQGRLVPSFWMTINILGIQDSGCSTITMGPMAYDQNIRIWHRNGQPGWDYGPSYFMSGHYHGGHSTVKSARRLSCQVMPMLPATKLSSHNLVTLSFLWRQRLALIMLLALSSPTYQTKHGHTWVFLFVLWSRLLSDMQA